LFLVSHSARKNQKQSLTPRSETRITADIYPYTAGATRLDAAMPTWVQAGGLDAWIARLKDLATRARVVREIAGPGGDWESLYRAAGSAENVGA